MSTPGYYRYPTICGETLAFVSEDDLWTVPRSGGVARRLTTSHGAISHPALSPDGRWLAFTSSEEGHAEVYLIPAAGGPVRRLTYWGAHSFAVGWKDDAVIVCSDVGLPFYLLPQVWSVPLDGGPATLLRTGPAHHVSFGPGGGVVIGRNAFDPARWKRYRGGTAGDLWIDRDGSGEFERLLQLDGNLSRPMWIGARIYFLSDHEGVGNLYSATPRGANVRRHTHHEAYYVRHPATDGRRIVYHCGADLHVFDPKGTSKHDDSVAPIAVAYTGPRGQRQRKFVSAEEYLTDYELHPKGHLLAISSRGKCFSFGNWDGPVHQLSDTPPARRRLVRWLGDGERLVLVSDASGEEVLELHSRRGAQRPKALSRLKLGRVVEMEVSPTADRVAITNHRNELLLVELSGEKSRVLDKSDWGSISGVAWSPDGKYVAYAFPSSQHTSSIRLASVRNGAVRDVTKPVLIDFAPSFDPGGKYLYFLGCRHFDPVFDTVHFDLGFPRGIKPYLVLLQKGQRSPFVGEPKEPEPEVDDKPSKGKKAVSRVKPIEIDFDGIESRVLAFPTKDGRYGEVLGIEGKVLFTQLPIEGTLSSNSWEEANAGKAALVCYDLEERKIEVLAHGISSVALSRDQKTMVIRAGERLRVLEAGAKPDEQHDDDAPDKKSGWIDLDRIRLQVEPALEWRQMLREAWRLQRDQFWTADMSKVDWRGVLRRYEPLVERVGTRTELSDLLWEMQGELGTSHAYELGGDHRCPPRYDVGLLGADLRFDDRLGVWMIDRIVEGDPWDSQTRSPLAAPGVDAQAGQTLLAIDGVRVTKETPPGYLLLNRAGVEVEITLGNARGRRPRTVAVKTLGSERRLRYRDWVESNRAWVHKKSKGRVGYVHVPDMGPEGYAEFHRYFLAELDRHGLVIDVRFNGGGFVSELILEKLARRRIGYDQSRWSKPKPYPTDSVAGPLVALTNEFAGSDGDIFSHGFKLLGLGPLIGKRTWGGVIGIWPRHSLVDGGVTTQPEFSFWFEDVGWGVENYGTDPDIDVEMTPEDFVRGRDPQLERALAEVQRLAKTRPNAPPTLGSRPNRSAPKLPKA